MLMVHKDFELAMAAPDLTPRWYAAYTCARHEKKVADQLGLRAVESYLPLYKTVHRWNGRRAEVELPLFSGYVFVRLPYVERLRVLQVPGVVRLVGFNGRPAPLPDDEMHALRECLLRRRSAEPHAYIAPGQRVRITDGALAGLEGVVERVKGKLRFVISMDLIMRSIAVEVDAADLEPVLGKQRIAA